MAFASALKLASIISNPEKGLVVSQALQSLDSKKGSFLGLFDEGGGRRNEMSIINGTSHAIRLVNWHLEWGYAKVVPDSYLPPMARDECLFHNAGSWACTGSSGIVTYKLNHQTNLHILWECPYNFDFSENYIGLMLSAKFEKSNKYLFEGMFGDWGKIEKTPIEGSTFDLVCCGPDRGSKSCGYRRGCFVQDQNYQVFASMGDRHATTSKITIIEND